MRAQTSWPGGGHRRPPRAAWSALLGSLLLAVGGLVACAAEPDEASARTLQYVLVAHPDDEYQGWSLIADRPEAYPVLILLTQGEATSRCDGSAFHPEHGERAPQPQPFDPEAPGRCAAQRVDAWHAFLDGMAGLDDHLEPGPAAGTTADGLEAAGAPAPPEDVPRSFEVLHGPDHARLVFDLGDGDLDVDRVRWAFESAREVATSGLLPVTEEGEALGVNFVNAGGYPDCVAYAHPDHVAVDEALWSHDFGLPGAQRSRVCATDPRVDVDDVTAEVPREVHDAVWEVSPPPIDPLANPGAERTGIAQSVYGWLAFSFTDDDVDRYWAQGGETITPFTREQHFWSRYGP